MGEYRLAFEAISTLSIEDLSKSFYEHCDGVLAERAGRVVVTVYVSGTSPLEAAHAAISQLEKLDMSVCHVDYDLVDGPEIAARLNVTRQAVQNWATGNRGSGFPRPVGSPGGKRVWAWSQIVEWARAEQGSEETPGLSRDEMAVVDTFLAERRQKVSYPGTIKGGSTKTQAGVRGVEDYRPSAVTLQAGA